MGLINISMYKNHQIQFNEDTEEFVVELKDRTVKDVALSILKSKIDRLLNNKFKHISIYTRKYQGLIKSKITSIDEQGDIWISDEKGNRGKHYGDENLYEFDDHNIAIAKELDKIACRIDQFEEQKEKLFNKLHIYKIKK